METKTVSIKYQSNSTFKVQDSWFASRDIVPIVSDQGSLELACIYVEQHGQKNEFILRIVKHGRTLNLLPTYGYNSIFFCKLTESFLTQVIKELHKIGITTCFMPVQFDREPEDIVDPKIIDYLSMRMPSYQIDLRNSMAELRSRVSKRRRTKLKLSDSEAMFIINEDELYKVFRCFT